MIRAAHQWAGLNVAEAELVGFGFEFLKFVGCHVTLDTKLTIGNPFGFKGSPYTVVIDRKGEMVAQIHGESAVTRLPRILDELLKNDPQPS